MACQHSINLLLVRQFEGLGDSVALAVLYLNLTDGCAGKWGQGVLSCVASFISTPLPPTKCCGSKVHATRQSPECFRA